MAGGRRIDGLALGAAGAGVLLVYSGLTGRGVLATVQALIQGTDPGSLAAPRGQVGATAQAAEAAAAATPPGAGTGGVSAIGGAALGVAIAQAAQKYVGTGYHFGGAPGHDINDKDCSSFANWVIGHDLGLAIPFYAAGTYTGADHGPPTGAWLAWGGATTIGHDPAAAQPGDLCVWPTHMGIAIGGGQMVSARSASAHPPTGTGAIATGGPRGEPLFVRRLNASTAGSSSSGSGGGGRVSAR